MAQDSSFDIVSEINLQTVDDAVNVALKEIQNRFDFKGVNVSIELKRADKSLEICTPSEMKSQQVKEILMQKFAKKEISYKSLSLKKSEKAANGGVKETYSVVCGIDKEIAKTIVKDIKDSGVKVQASIQEEKVRVSGKSKDDLQKVIQLMKGKDYPIPLQFTNYR